VSFGPTPAPSSIVGASTFFKTIQNEMHWAAHGRTASPTLVCVPIER
jgi:hypothetical protein